MVIKYLHQPYLQLNSNQISTIATFALIINGDTSVRLTRRVTSQCFG